jgi:Arc/MetJ-type ribon-helix-helix transcriptional regulator
MKLKTISISVPETMAEFIEQEVDREFASTSDFFRTLVREYQAAVAQEWIDTQTSMRLATAGNEKNLVPHDDFEREVLGQG